MAYALSVTSMYQECASEAHWIVVKTIHKYLRMTHEMSLVYGSGECILEGGGIAQVKESRSHHTFKHILRRYHLLWEVLGRGDMILDYITSTENTADPLTKPILDIAHTQHLHKMGLSQIGDWL
ncbi:hypothetical protein Sango_1525300 [Sesamum angolense]|uniref:Uncharacterized protein n=1 Tax=Sesamum angolense TaxID=2727404 RepID=A0AAE2BT91_9LAMI|nr:hypothetical protein Sango_1525300 [Sesamum angolense]